MESLDLYKDYSNLEIFTEDELTAISRQFRDSADFLKYNHKEEAEHALDQYRKIENYLALKTDEVR